MSHDDTRGPAIDDDPTDGGDGVAPGAVQLGLFSPGSAEVEAAFARLERLELEAADDAFRSVVARDAANHHAAEGLAAVAHWRRVLAACDDLPAPERADGLWLALRGCPPRLLTRRLRHRLLREVLESLETGLEQQATPTVCAGEVLLALNRPAAARSWLDWAVPRQPESARLQLVLGDVLWRAESVSAARACYSRGLRLDPTLEQWREAAWRELARSAAAVGAVATALEWWATGRLPVPPPDTVGEPHPRLAEVWRALAAAEAARAGRQVDEVLRCRIRLRELAPVLFELYMERIEAG